MLSFMQAFQGRFLSPKGKHSVGRGKERASRSRALRMEPLEHRTVLSLTTGTVVLEIPSDIPDVHALQISLPNPAYDFVDLGNGWQQIVSEDLSAGGDSGNPELPSRVLRILLPSDTDLSSVTLQGTSSSEQVLAGVHAIKPVEPMATDTDAGVVLSGYADGAKIVGGLNLNVYETNAYYGGNLCTLVDCQQMGKYKFADILYDPFSYNPVSGNVKVAEDVGFSLNYRSGSPEDSTLLARTFEDADASATLLNFQDAAQWYPVPSSAAVAEGAAASSTASYVIVTTSAIQAGSTRLADFVTEKQAEGFSVLVATESTWNSSGGAGNAAAENLRSWLKANYASMGIQYVMLIGNPDPTSGDVPMKMTYPRNRQSSDKESPTDYYYSEMTSNWDSDGDGYYGEWGNNIFGQDFNSIPACEINVGRIPVYGTTTADFATLDGILQKTIDYKHTSNIDWRKSMLLPMAISNYVHEDNDNTKSRTDGSTLGEAIKSNIASAYGYSTYRLYEQAGLSPCTTTCEAALSEGNFISAWTANDYGIVDWWAHGSQTSASRKYWATDTDGDGVADGNEMTWTDMINVNDCTSLDNAHPSVVMQISCQNGWPENSSSLGYSLLKQGAIATLSASRNSWYRVNSYYPSDGMDCGDNASYAYYVTQQMVSNTSKTIGQALNWCHSNFGGTFSSWSSGSTWMNCTDFNIFGDPSISLGMTGPEAPEMDLLGGNGNSKLIVDGDTTPNTTDWTDFGSVTYSSGSVSRSYTIKNVGNGTLNLTGSTKVVISGANPDDFTVVTQPSSAAIAAGGTLTFTIKFDPLVPGLRTATVSISNDDANESVYDFSIQGTGTEPEMNLKGNSLDIPDGDTAPSTADWTDFGSVSVSSGNLQHKFYIYNTGLGNLSLNSTVSQRVIISGANAADFTVTQPSSSNIVSGSSTNFVITFDPSGPGIRTATVTIANNDIDENPYDFVIQGFGTSPEINLQGNAQDIADGDTTPSTADHTDFGSVEVVGATQSYTFTIQNTGSENLTLGGSPIVTVAGANASDFTVTSQPSSSTVAAGSSTTFTVRFDPSAMGLRTATISIANNDSNENPCDFAIQGIGLATEINLQGNGQNIVDGDTTPNAADHTDFGSVDVVGGTQSYTFTIQNVGNEALTLSGSPLVEITGANASDFTVISQPSSSTVAGGASLTFTVQFDPSAMGLRRATLRIANSDSDENPYDFAIEGNGLAPEIYVQSDGMYIGDGDTTPSVLEHTDFGSVAVDAATRSYSFTIQNTGNKLLTLSGSPMVEIAGANASDFTVVSQPSSSTVAIDGFVTFIVEFNPSGPGLRTATISIVNDDADENPFDFAIQGSGTTPDMNLQGNGLDIADGDTTPSTADFTDFGSVDIIAGTQSYTFTIRNTGSEALTLTGSPLVEITGANASDFTITSQPSNSTIAAGGSLTFTVEFNPSDFGLRTATIGIASNDADETPYEFSIQGTGFLGLTTFVWDGGGSDGLWNTPANWDNNIAPISGAILIFPAGAGQTVENNFEPGTEFGSIVLEGSGYVLQGNSIWLAVELADNAATGENTVALSISGSGGITKNGSDTLVLSGNNTYTGETAILGGSVSTGNVGSPSVSIVVRNDAVLSATSIVCDSLTIGGTDDSYPILSSSAALSSSATASASNAATSSNDIPASTNDAVVPSDNAVVAAAVAETAALPIDSSPEISRTAAVADASPVSAIVEVHEVLFAQKPTEELAVDPIIPSTKSNSLFDPPQEIASDRLAVVLLQPAKATPVAELSTMEKSLSSSTVEPGQFSAARQVIFQKLAEKTDLSWLSAVENELPRKKKVAVQSAASESAVFIEPQLFKTERRAS